MTGLNDQTNDITYGNGIWVAVAYRYVYYSTDDAVTWNKVQAGDTDTNWLYICYGDGKFVITTNTNYQKYSTDGKTWINCDHNYSLTTSTAKGFGNITYGNGIWVAAGTSKLYAYSTDGITWDKSEVEYHPISGVYYCNNIFLAGASTDPGASYSTDGLTWTKLNGITSGHPPRKFAYGNGIYVGIYDYKDTTWIAYYSTDGINWIKNDITSTNNTKPNDILYFGGYFIICSGFGMSAITNTVHMSTDGKNWNEYTLSDTKYSYNSIGVNIDSGKVIMTTYGTSGIDNCTIATCNGIPDLNWVN